MRTLGFLALAFTTACAGPTPTDIQTAIAKSAKLDAGFLKSQYEPALTACLAYAKTGAVDTGRLVAAGFVGPRRILGRDAFDNKPVQVVISERAKSCRINWNSVMSGADARAALTAMLAQNGYQQTGRDGKKIVYASQTETIGVTSQFIISVGMQFRAVETTFFNRAP